MPISYKNKIYTTLGTPTELSGNVVSTTDSAGVPAKDYTVKGKTIVWNQFIKNGNFIDKNNWFPGNGTGSVSNNEYTFTVTGTQTFSDIIQYMDKSFFIAGHKYYVTATITPQYSAKQVTVALHNGAIQQQLWTATASSGKTNFVSTTFTVSSNFVSGATDSTRFILYCPQTESAQGDITEISNVWMTDLTKMFGAGNEPSTLAEFRAMFPDDYYPYNAGELKTIVPTSVEASGVERFQLLDKRKYPATRTMNGVTFTNNGDGTFTVNGNATNSAYIQLNTITMKLRHKYLINDGDAGVSFGSYCTYLNVIGSNVANTSSSNEINIYTANQNILCSCYIRVNSGIEVPTVVFKPQLFDLTEMFGAGNEPATVAEFWQRVPEKLYGYNSDAYKRVNIPSSKYFPDGIRSAGSVYDEINFLSQKAIKRIGSVDLGTLNWTYAGVNNKYFETTGISDIKKISGPSEVPGLLNAIYPVSPQSNWILNKPCMFKIQGNTPAFCISDPAYTDAAAFKAAMSGVMLYYELATPIETAITPPLQALSTFNGFTSFSAPNSLMQNGPLSVTYYAEGGANPEKGWLMSYKRKLYMGRSIEWNQLFTNSRTSSDGVAISQEQDGTITLNGTSNQTYINFSSLSDAMNQVHKYLLYLKILNNPDKISIRYGWLNRGGITDSILNGETCTIYNQTEYLTQGGKSNGLAGFTSGTVFNNVKVAVMVMDLTQMFGAGNEPTTPAEFWSYFDHKLYPYNPGETQLLFKISRKSQWGGAS